jgi:glycosyltransferase involved in cell wall biosynthesis
VLFLIGTLEIGGAEKQLVEIASGLDRRRFAASVCCLSNGGPLAGALAAAGVPTVSLGFFSGRTARRMNSARRPLWRRTRWAADTVRAAVAVPTALIRLFRVIRACRPDVLHGMLFHAYILGAFTGVLMRVPVVVASRRSLSLFKTRRPLYRAAERLANRWTDLVIANSEAVRLDTMRTERLSPERVTVIHNGIDPARYSAVDPALVRRTLDLDDRPTAIVIANFLPYKDHAGFLAAWGAVCREFEAACALLVGDGPLRAALEEQVRSRGLVRNVRFLGLRRDVPDLLAAADLLVHPSLEEGFSNAILEAMAAGRPVVATDVGGNAEAVCDGRTGWLVPPRDTAALTHAILRMLRDPACARAMGAAGRARVLQQFQMATMVEKYEATYRALLAARPKAAR